MRSTTLLRGAKGTTMMLTTIMMTTTMMTTTTITDIMAICHITLAMQPMKAGRQAGRSTDWMLAILVHCQAKQLQPDTVRCAVMMTLFCKPPEAAQAMAACMLCELAGMTA